MSDIFGAEYDPLNDIVRLLLNQVDDMEHMLQQLCTSVENLRFGGWTGLGADFFFSEFDCEVVPELRRYITLLEETSDATKRTIVEAHELDDAIILLLQGAHEYDQVEKTGTNAELNLNGIPAAKVANTGTLDYTMHKPGQYHSDADGGLNGTPGANTLYINGIQTSADAHRETLNMVSKALGGKPVTGIYNKTDSMGGDLYQALNDQFEAKTGFRVLSSNPAVQNAIAWIRAHPNGEIMVHSQGGAIISAGLSELAREGFDLSGLKVTTMGGAGVTFPPGPQYHHYVHVQDIVPMGTRTFLDPNSLVTSVLSPNVTVIVDDASGYLPGIEAHGVDHYLNNLPEFQQAEQGKAEMRNAIGDTLLNLRDGVMSWFD